MNTTLNTPNPSTATPTSESHPPIHMEYIRHRADISEDDGVAQVMSYHQAIFNHRHGAEQEHLHNQIKNSESRLKHLESEWNRASEKAKSIEPIISEREESSKRIEPNQPWNGWDRCMFVMAGLGVLCLVVFGVLNISFNLIESGLVIFGDHPYRAYFWAALLPVGALGIKIGWDMITSSSFKSIYVWGCLAAGFIGVVAWLLAYASIYPSLSLSTAEQLESIQLFETGEPTRSMAPFGNVKWVDMILVVSQAVAELFLSAALGIYMTLLYQKHQAIKPALHPEYLHWNEERLKFERSVFEERSLLAKARGRMKELDSQLTVYLAYAKSVYEREIALNREGHTHKERLLTELVTDVMDRLQSIRTQRESNHLITDTATDETYQEAKTA